MEAFELEYEATSHGDCRVCPKHPGVTTSSTDGLFDAPCGACEYETETWQERREEIAWLFGCALAGVEVPTTDESWPPARAQADSGTESDLEF